jgi:hypothetical protein
MRFDSTQEGGVCLAVFSITKTDRSVFNIQHYSCGTKTDRSVFFVFNITKRIDPRDVVRQLRELRPAPVLLLWKGAERLSSATGVPVVVLKGTSMLISFAGCGYLLHIILLVAPLPIVLVRITEFTPESHQLNSIQTISLQQPQRR